MRRSALWMVLAMGCGGAEAPKAVAPASAPAVVAAPAAPAAPAAGRKVVVTVSGDGFSPGAIQANPRERLTLAFDRAEEGNCGDEVVFAGTGQRVALPVGRITDVPVEAPASGELAFGCGMGMYQGKVVVVGG